MAKKNPFITVEDFEKKYNIGFCFKHTGKMSGMVSLSTSVLLNPYCQARRKIKGSICEKCFAAAQFEFRKTMQDKYARNTAALTSQIIPIQEWPLLNVALIRLESFGDLNNVNQVINYFNLAKKNKHAKVVLWTKNPGLVDKAIKAGHKKPGNMIIIVSSLFINTVSDFPKYNYFIDKYFTVYNDPFITENNVNITCGARSCLNCQRCYHKTKNIEYVNEKLK